jgi:hypothetical protein
VVGLYRALSVFLGVILARTCGKIMRRFSITMATASTKPRNILKHPAVLKERPPA